MKRITAPKVCPNLNCETNQNPASLPRFDVHGRYLVKGTGERRIRFICGSCGKTVSQTARDILTYRLKRVGVNERIFDEITASRSGCEAARRVGVSEHCVRIRIRRMAIAAYCGHAALVANHKIRDDIVFDGLRNFAKSQFDPNEINHFVLKKSQFILYFNFSPLNRSGLMSERQKKICDDIVQREGEYPKSAVRSAVGNAIRWIHERNIASSPLRVYSDEHFQYRRAIERDLSTIRIHHIKISSKKKRTFRNGLFPVNFIDNMIRKDSAAFARETLCFSKHHIGMVDRYALFSVKRNYMMPAHTKRLRSAPDAHVFSPAQRAGVVSCMFSFDDFFGDIDSSRVSLAALSEDWRLFVQGRVPFPRVKKGDPTITVGHLEANGGET